MHLQAGGAAHLHLQYFMPQHQPQEPATDLEAQESSAVCRRSSSTSPPPPPTTMWEYHQAAHAAALQTTSSPASSFPSWSPYAGTTAALLGASSAFISTDAAGADSSSPGMRLLPAGEHGGGHAYGEQSNITCYKENFLDLLASKNVTQEMFDDVPAGHYTAQALLSGRFAAGSDVAPPVKYEVTGGSPLFFGSAAATGGMHQQGMDMAAGCTTPRYTYGADHHQMKEGGDQQQELASPAMASFLQQLSSNAAAGGGVGMHAASMDYSGTGGGLDRICHESRALEASPFGMRSLPDLSSFGGYRRSTTAESTSSAQPYLQRSSSLAESSRQQEPDIVSARSSSSGSGAASERKKRASEERTSTVKKSKQEGSKPSPPKQQQVPKVKIGEKITALQQIVSPFGKTDTASVLFETIKYIKFLHEQVQLLSEPYTNSSRSKVQYRVITTSHGEIIVLLQRRASREMRQSTT
ncbi:uncharacterized protein [Zea mays]|uniref:BHLH domain-containing protein n=1 Tax=Zea mays TaxID=4577 RepID=A0A804PLT2_MAIZE|nr:uncharacterized protein LOC100276393 isoform X2 [Zea mays]|eukprot:XP_020408813.1 uncharacterized protein LOC100276393 isoform X2 [Zea mays]